MAMLSRSPLIAVEHLRYNAAMFDFAPYGPYWRKVRKLITVELLSGKRVEQLQHIRDSEMSLSMKELYQLWAEKKNGSSLFVVELKRWFGDLNLNVVVGMVAVKTYRVVTARRHDARRCLERSFSFWGLSHRWKIHRDPQVRSEPLEFKSERFLSTHKDVDVKGHDFELMPFGACRRSCLAINFGLLMVHLTLATFLQAFDFSTVSDELVDMTESPGLINVKVTPLEVLVTP